MNRTELAPDRLCESCAKSPTGVDGHDKLERFDESIRPAAGNVAFECRGCGALWYRSYAGEGRFVWALQRPGSVRARG